MSYSVSVPVLVHYHIFKNAGTSIDAMLRTSLGDRWCSFEGKSSVDVQSSAALSGFLAKHPSIRAVSTHLARPPLPRHGHPIVFLRDPLLRAMSVYRFVRLDRQQDGHRHALGGLKEYFKWALDSDDGGVVVRDYQVIHLSKASFRGPIHAVEAQDHDLAEAKALVDSFGFVGIVEHFERSIALYQQRYRSLFPAVSFDARRDNRTNSRTPMNREVMAFLLGSHLFQRMCDANERDQQLYDYARALLARHHQKSMSSEVDPKMPVGVDDLMGLSR